MITRKNRTPIMHRVVKHNGVIYVGGVIADDLSQSMAGQTRQALDKIGQLLIEAGTDKTKVLAATIYVTDLGQKAGMNDAWVDWFGSEDLPTRATIGVADLGPGVLIEIVVTAAA